MNPPDILHQHQQLCEEIHGCVLGENRFLRQYQPGQGWSPASGTFNALVGTQPFDIWKR